MLMFKNKALGIKLFLKHIKNKLKIFQIFKQTFNFAKHYKTIFKNYS